MQPPPQQQFGGAVHSRCLLGKSKNSLKHPT